MIGVFADNPYHQYSFTYLTIMIRFFCILLLMMMYFVGLTAQPVISDEKAPKFITASFFYKPYFISRDRIVHANFHAAFLNFRRLSLGPTLNTSFLDSERYTSIEANHFSVGPFARYYFGKYRLFFVESSLGYGQAYYRRKYIFPVSGVRELLELGVAGGISAKLYQRWHIDLQVKNYSNLNVSAERGEKLQLIVLAGVHYRL